MQFVPGWVGWGDRDCGDKDMRNAAIGLILMLAGMGVLRAEGKPEVNLVFLGFAGYSELSPSGEVVGRGVEMVESIFAEAGYPIC